jgi:serine phosphatase RsbU (regulator of sigma subunit)
MKSDNAPGGSLVEGISTRIESLQEGFKRLSRSATVNDLADRFGEALRSIMPGATVDVAWRADESKKFNAVVGGGEASRGILEKLSGEKFSRPCTLRDRKGSLVAVQKLIDASQVAVVISARTDAESFGEADAVTLRVFVQFFDAAYQDMVYRRNEKNLVFSLNHRILQLNSLIETGIEVAKLDHNDAPHRLAIVRAASLTNASKGVVTVTEGKTVTEEFTFPVGSTVDRSAKEISSIVSSFSFLDKTWSFELFDKESRAGVTPFEETDHLLLDALARQVHASLENRYLHEQALEKQRIEQEMSVAASIQQKILPVGLPEIRGYDLFGINIPSKSVGGDYYNCIPLHDGRFALIIADVAGKGVPAALLVSSLHAYLSAYLEGSFAMTRLAARLNKVMYNDSTADKFITAFFAILTPETGDLECLSAGHNPAYLLRKDGSIQELHAGGLPLGTIDMDIPYKSERVTLEKGERLFLYTDGVTEAENEDHVLYEHEFPITDFLSKDTPESSEAFIADLIADIRRFTRTAPQNDDITAMYMRRL